jgi:hypothetical protein
VEGDVHQDADRGDDAAPVVDLVQREHAHAEDGHSPVCGDRANTGQQEEDAGDGADQEADGDDDVDPVVDCSLSHVRLTAPHDAPFPADTPIDVSP